MRRTAVRGTMTVLAAGALLAGLAPAALGDVAGRPLPSERPQAGPQIADGIVHTILQVDDVLYVGGTFTKVQSGGSTVARRGVVAWNTRTKSLVSGFAPQLDGPVMTLAKGPGGAVYVGGEFSRVNGVAGKLALLNGATGARVATFSPPAMNGTVQDVQVVGDLLYVGGTFSTVGGKAHGGIATLRADSGALDDKMSSNVSGHHAWTGEDPNQAKGAVGVEALDVTPDGSRLVAIGNFTDIDGQHRDQVAMWDLTTGTASLRSYAIPRYEALCKKGYDSYVRDVDISPDGNYFVVVSTGGKFGGSLCDTAGKFAVGDSGLAVEPVWVAASGADSLLSVAITDTAVFVGGHQRWMNNPLGGDVPKAGAVPRPGIAALDPVNGVPLAWNPGRHPRGAGTYALLPTADGLWVGSDTNRLGHLPSVNAQKIGFFPLAGGSPSASKALGPVPGRVFVGSGTALTSRAFDGSTASAPTGEGSPFDVSKVRGIFTVGSTVFYGKADGKLYERTLSGGTFGPEALVDPYNDPYWSPLANGSGTTYRGVVPGFYGAELASVTSMFYDGVGKIFYTLAGKSQLYWRSFSPDVKRRSDGSAITTGGVVHPVRGTVQGVSLPGVTGAFLASNGFLYYSKADGSLTKVAFANGRPSGAGTKVGAGVDWNSRALFLAPG